MLKTLMQKYLNLLSGKTVKLREMEAYLQKELGQKGYWQKEGGYPALVQEIKALEEAGLLRPVKASGLNGRQPPLFLRYRRELTDVFTAEMRQKLLTQYHPLIKMTYYLTREADYRAAQPYLSKIDSFLKKFPDFPKWPLITANERSFQIFNDEKWLLSPQGHLFCQHTGLSLTILRCSATQEPFFYYGLNPGEKRTINILIVENKDTFFSLKRLWQEGLRCWAATSFVLLIYGEGRKIQKSLRFYEELKEYQDCEAHFYYFGDLDPEGIRIWFDLGEEYQLEIKPFVFFYELLFTKYGAKAPRLVTKQRDCPRAWQAFLAYFPTDIAVAMAQMLAEKKYLPQEGLNYVILKEFAESCRDNG